MPVSEVLLEAKRLVAVQTSVIPIRADGSKAPAVDRWDVYQRRLPTERELHHWFGNGPRGLAIVGGAISRHTECMDFDDIATFKVWRGLVHEECAGLLERLVIVSTPRPGFQVWYRCDSNVGGNRKLARGERLAPETGELKLTTLIETRGEGGYAIIPPSPRECHPNHKSYHVAHGDLTARPVISAEERQILWEAALSLNEHVEPDACVVMRPASKHNTGLRPGDDFNQRGDFASLLQRHGWTLARKRGAVQMWRRPGKTKGWSATLGFDGPGLLHVFSTNAQPFEADHWYDLFGAYTRLEHQGDWKAATRQLRQEGYGDQRALPPPVERTEAPGEIVIEGEIVQEQTEPELASRLMTFAQLLAAAPLSWVIEGAVQDESLLMVYGPTNEGKTFIGATLAHAVRTGGEWCGRTVHRKGSVLYVNAEYGAEFGERARAWQIQHAAARLPEPEFEFYTFPDPIHLHDPQEMHKLYELMRWLKPTPALVVFDTYSQCIPGVDENDQAAGTLVVMGLRRILRDFGATAAVIHHTNATGQRERGSTVLPNAAHTHIRVDMDKATKIITASCKKQRGGPRFDPINFSLTVVPGTSEVWPQWLPERHSSMTPQQQAREERLEKILLFVRELPGSPTENIQLCFNMTERTCLNDLAELEQRKLIFGHRQIREPGQRGQTPKVWYPEGASDE